MPPTLRQRPQRKSHTDSLPSSPYSTRKTPVRSSGSTMAMANNPQHPLLVPAREAASAALSEPHGTPSYNTVSTTPPEEMDLRNMSHKTQWIVLALASGACAAFNGVFAKLTTTELTTHIATWIAKILGLADETGEKIVEVVIRSIFFGLNLIFNGIMWALFTKALKRGTSTTQVSILNTSSNFMITAILGFIIFSESLPPLWWLGAALLVAGNVIIGRRDEGEDSKDTDVAERAENGEGYSRVDGEEGERLLVHLPNEPVELELERKKQTEEEDILDLTSEHGDGRVLMN